MTNTLSGYPKIKFFCEICGYTGKTSGFPTSCPKCLSGYTRINHQYSKIPNPTHQKTLKEELVLLMGIKFQPIHEKWVKK